MASISNPFRINSTTAETQTDVQLAALDNGSVVAVWSTLVNQANAGLDIAGQMFSVDGAKIGGEFIVNTERAPGLWNGVYQQTAPDVAALSDGGFIVVYRDGRASDGTISSPAQRAAIVGQRYDANGNKIGTDDTLVPGITYDGNPLFPTDPEVVPAGAGFTIVYDSARFIDGRVFGQDYDYGVYASGYSLGGAVTAMGGDRFGIKTVNSVIAGKQDGSKVEALLDNYGYANGNSVVVWFTNAIAGTPPDGIMQPDQLKAQIVGAGGTLIGSEIAIPRVSKLDAFRGDLKYDVAALPGGAFIVTWQSDDNILFQIVNADGSMRGGIKQAHAPDGIKQTAPAVSGRFDGSFLITWTDNADMSGSGRVVGQLFNADGSKNGELLALSISASNNLPTASQIVTTSVGTYFVAWNDAGPVGDGEGLTGVIIDPSGTGGPGGGSGPKVSVTGASNIKEGTGGSTSYEFTLKLDAPATKQVTIDYTISGAGASPAGGADFSFGAFPYKGTVTFEIGHDEITIPVPIVADALRESNETFQIVLSNPTNGLGVAQGTHTVAIADDDATPSLITAKIKGAATVESGGSVSYTVTLDRAPTKAEEVKWSVLGVNSPKAAADDDLLGGYSNGTLTFQAGETSKTITIATTKNVADETDEAFAVELTQVSSGLTLKGDYLLAEAKATTIISSGAKISDAIVDGAEDRVLGVSSNSALVSSALAEYKSGAITIDAFVDQVIALAGTSGLPAAAVARALGVAWPSEEHFAKLAEFCASQFAAYTAQQVLRPQLGPYEALGVGFSELPAFGQQFGLVSDVDFPALAYRMVFGRDATAAQALHFNAQNQFFENLYLGVGQSAAQADIHAKGAVIGQMIGFAVLDETSLHSYDDIAAGFLRQVVKGQAAFGQSFDLI